MTLDPPDLSVLSALDDDTWAPLVGHARRVLRELGAGGDGLDRLRGASTVDLLTGEGRAALAAELASGGRLWEGVAARLADESEAAWRDRLRPARPATAAANQDADAAVRRRARKERIRELTEQRDHARRQVDGAEARARAAEQRLGEARDELRGAREHVAELERQLDEAAGARAAALDRQRRRWEAETASLREELRALRRAEEERRAERRRRAEARAAREAAEVARADDRAGVPDEVRPGRPTRLPPELRPGTSAAARALLTSRHQVLVDGYNLTLRHRAHLNLEQQRASLIAILEGVVARFRCDVSVLFDSRHGSPPATGRSRAVRVRFTAPGVTADDEIVFEVSAAPEDQPVLVVTDDHELRDRLGPYEVDLLRTGEFLRAVE